MELTQVIRRRRAQVVGPPSLRAQLLLVVSAFLAGAVAAGLLFVGIWRHTASDGARAHAAQLADHGLLVASRHRVAVLGARLDRAGALLAAARHDTAAARASLAANGTIARSLQPRAQTLSGAAGALASKLTTLESELRALEAYARQPGPSGVDPGYVATQTGYLKDSADTALAAASTLARDAQSVQALASQLNRRK